MIVHFTRTSHWEQFDEGPYRHPTLDDQGFIHFSDPDQVLSVANSDWVPKEPSYKLLCVDPDRLDAEVVYEGEPEAFPHVYGPVPMEAIVAVVPFPLEDGTFRLPDELKERFGDP